jgi:hypothetical protein
MMEKVSSFDRLWVVGILIVPAVIAPPSTQTASSVTFYSSFLTGSSFRGMFCINKLSSFYPRTRSALILGHFIVIWKIHNSNPYKSKSPSKNAQFEIY